MQHLISMLRRERIRAETTMELSIDTWNDTVKMLAKNFAANNPFFSEEWFYKECSGDFTGGE